MRNTYFKVFILIFILVFGTIATSAAQVESPTTHNHGTYTGPLDTIKRVIINTTEATTLRLLHSKGLDFTCGSTPVSGGIQMDLNPIEINILEDENIPYTITIDNVTEFLSNRNLQKLPEARAELQRLKNLSKGMKPVPLVDSGENTKSFSQSNESISSPIQYDDCAEVDWTPQNFVLGSMGGAYNYQEILDELARMNSLYPDIITVVQDVSSTGQQTLPYSADGITIPAQTMWYVKISDNPTIDENTTLGEPQSLITGAAHANEVSSVMNIIYYMWYILENYNSDPLITSMINNQELLFIPVINPSGYIYNGILNPNGGGAQRKNLRNNNSGTYTKGIDLNRNSPYYWGVDNNGSSAVNTSGTYRGTSPASENETQIIADFIQSRNIKLAVNHHSGLNSIVTSSYNGDTAAAPSGREDEFQELMQNVTHYNRYIHGSAPETLYEANGDFNDWMLGGVPVQTNPDQDNNGTPDGVIYTSSGSGKDIIAFTPENGDEQVPDPTHIVNIAKRAVRMNLITSLSAGKYAQLHDLTRTDLGGANNTLDFAIEYIGQTLDDLTLTVTPISANIDAITPLSAGALNGMTKLEQREVSLPITFSAGIQPNELVEYEVTLSNGDFDIFQTVYRKYYNPTLVINADGIANWTGSWVANPNGYNGSTNAISLVPSGPYGDNLIRTTTLNAAQDLSTSEGYIIQFNAFWDIERNFDLVQLEASTDGSNWTALCGKYNKPAATAATNNHFKASKGGPGNPSNHQEVNGTYVYDGDQIVNGVEKWVMEEIFIDFENNTEFLGETGVQFRFRFDSDGSNEDDGYNTDFAGFVFDNFRILSLESYTPELCEDAAINAFPYSESFENGLGVWSQNQEDDGDWSRNQGSTPSGPTGPLNANDGNFYLYTEATEDNAAPGENLGNNATAILTSPCFDLTNATSASLNFDYHMFGANMGSLSVEVLDDDTFVWTPIFTQNGATGTAQSLWNSETAALTPYLGRVIKIRFVGTTGGGFASDMAIDHIDLVATIADSIPPTAICQNITASLGADGSVTILPEQIDNGSTDDVSISSLSLDVDTFDCSNVGVNNVILTVTDAGNNTDTCTATVTIEPYITAPDGLMASTVTASTATLSWNATAGSDYQVRFRESGTTSWSVENLTTNTYDLTLLNASTPYDVEVRANCSTGNTPFSTTYNFTTTALTYCTVGGIDSASEYIQNVTLNNGTTDLINNTTAGTPGGYEDYTGSVSSAALERNSTISISVTKHRDDPSWNEAVSVWIDFNKNGAFTDAGEQVVNDASSTIATINTSGIIIPSNAILGETRMRVAMKYYGAAGSNHTDSCESFQYGEVEDYAVTIEAVDYVYDAGLWAPGDPSGVSTSDDNIQVLSGSTSLTANTLINNITIAPGAVFDLGSNVLSSSGTITNNGTLSASQATLLLHGNAPQSMVGTGFDLGSLELDNVNGAIILTPIELKNVLTLTSGELNTNNLLTLGSDINGSAMVATITGGSITGDVTTEQYIPAKRAFRLIGSTVTTTSNIQANWQEGLSSNVGFGTHITGSTDGSNGFDTSDSGNYSLFTLNNPGQAWEAVTNTDVNTLTAGQPMRLMVRGDRSIDISSNTSPATVTTLRATGQLATGTVQTTGASLNHTANSFNFVGNPYQASVNINNVLSASSNINDSQIFVWDATLGDRGQYVTVTLDGTGSSNGANSKNYHYLQPGQAIFTRTLATVGDNSTSIVFSEADKIVGQNIPVYAQETNTMFDTAHIIGRLYRADRYGLDEGLQDNFVLLFTENNENSITSIDAAKFFNIDENMAIANGETLLSVEHRAMPEIDEEVQFFNASYRAADYTIDINTAGLENVTAYFVDTFNNTSTPLDEGWNSINFSVDSDDSNSTRSDRFKIRYEERALDIEENQANTISLFPNPLKGDELTISSSTFSGEVASVRIINILGQTVFNKEVIFTNTVTKINNLNNLQSGVYFLTVQSDSSKATRRIIVQ